MTLSYRLHMAGPQGHRQILLWTPSVASLQWEDGTDVDLRPVGQDYRATQQAGPAFPVSPAIPAGKSPAPRVLKIQLGLKCNYTCQYCNQAAQPQDSQGDPGDVASFLAGLPSWLKAAPQRIEFWGGEPFAYWKTLRPLAEALRERFPAASFGIVSNGSLLDEAKIDWLDRLGFGIGISHDGPAMKYRGPDPLDNPQQRDVLRMLYDRLKPQGRMSFNTVLHRRNMSLTAVRRHIAERLDVPAAELPLVTEEILLPYDDGGLRLSLRNERDGRAFMHEVFWEAVRGESMAVSTIRDKISGFFRLVATARPAASLGQKCGMDDPAKLAVDLKGNALTCQNMSADTRHRIGHVSAISEIRLNTAHHWSTREECGRCPVLPLCQEACLFLEQDLWRQACDNSYWHNLAIFAAALYWLTRLVLIEIEGPARRDGLPARMTVIDPAELEVAA
ncbi:radical SAM protein [Ferrovibrio sp.]|uniref:radical SAM/SPASM domain-containing protein n=1 Tax=Ferrovibrio sp. TaxID=1917215 RepID=UPI00262F6AFF|nr:radical SAM protein [Ferrovibrio sp.]